MAANSSGRLAGKVALITGAGTGIGRAIALLFAQEGTQVVLVGRRREPLTEVAARAVELTEDEHTEGKVLVMDGDISSEHTCTKVIERTQNGFGRLDILVNNAGTFARAGLLDTDEATWDDQIATNLTGTYLMTKAALPALVESKGNIINISSTCGIRPVPNTAAYSAAKAGVVSLTQTTALEYAPQGVRVNCIAPGVVETPMHLGNLESEADLEQFRTDMAAMHPLGRVGQPEDIAKAALFLASDEAVWVTGVVLPVDGGIALT